MLALVKVSAFESVAFAQERPVNIGILGKNRAAASFECSLQRFNIYGLKALNPSQSFKPVITNYDCLSENSVRVAETL